MKDLYFIELRAYSIYDYTCKSAWTLHFKSKNALWRKVNSITYRKCFMNTDFELVELWNNGQTHVKLSNGKRLRKWGTL